MKQHPASHVQVRVATLSFFGLTLLSTPASTALLIGERPTHSGQGMFVLWDINHMVCEMCATERQFSRIVMISLQQASLTGRA